MMSLNAPMPELLLLVVYDVLNGGISQLHMSEFQGMW